MYYVIIVVPLNMVCAALIAAPSHPFWEAPVEFLGFVPSAPSAPAVVNVADCDVHFGSKDVEWPWSGEKGNADWEKGVWAFNLLFTS